MPAGLKNRGDQLAAQAFKDMMRLITGLLAITVKQCQLLFAVNDIFGIVKVQNDDWWRFCVGVEKMVQKSDSHAIEFGPTDHVLKQAEGG
jgi:hypothetical protein